MRPIKLTMKAFGPYSGVEVINFKELKDRNLFLITGPTGSGKTTLFDAISFSMYGEASGNLRSAESLRSQYAKADVLTRVELEFELRGIKYYLTREPKQEKLKSKGVGYTEHKPTAQLIIEGVDNPIVGVKNVNDKIEEIVGINADQFRQIMMIPQGEFRKLLTSDSQEREKVLQKLFDTSLYNLMQNKLDNEAKIVSRSIKDYKNIRDHELERLNHSDDVLLNLISNENKNVNEILSMLIILFKQDENELMLIKKEIDSITKNIETCIKDREKAKEVNEKLKLKEKLSLEISNEDKKLDDINIKKELIGNAEKALLIMPVENMFNERLKEFEGQKKSLSAITSQLKTANESFIEIKQEYEYESSDERVKIRDEFIKKISILSSFYDKVMSIEKLKNELVTSNEKYKKLSNSKIKVEGVVENYKKSIEDLQRRMEVSKDSSIKLLELKEEVTKLNSINEKLFKLKNIKEKLVEENNKKDKLEIKLKGYEIELNEVTNNYKKNKISFFLNQAAILAKDLEDGKPCPVCGSTEHVKLAEFTSNSINEKELDSLESEMKEVEKKVRRQRENLLITLERIQKMDSDFDEISEENLLIDDITNNEKKLLLLDEEVKSLKTLCEATDIINKEIITIKDSLSKAENELNKNISEMDTINKEVTSNNIKLNNIFDEVPEDIRDIESLEHKINELKLDKKSSDNKFTKIKEEFDAVTSDVIKLTSKSEEMTISLKEKEAIYLKTKENLEEKINNSGFESYDDYINAKISEKEVVILKNIVDDYEKNLHNLKSKYEELRIEMKDLVFFDIIIYDEKIQLLKSNNSEMQRTYSNVEKRLENNKLIVNEVSKIEKKIYKEEKTFEILGNLASISQGRNKSMITFERYVLAAFLDDILKAANYRLSKMTQGRYILSRTEELERKNKQSGLELEVFDNYTGKSRHVKTLSGGEGFKASLSMALGLSDVVQSYSGGVRLDTMFIDEGFGTLDQESLDSAISCLIDLQNSGRLVGIISHVEELKERIDTRLEVTSTNTGSSTRFLIT